MINPEKFELIKNRMFNNGLVYNFISTLNTKNMSEHYCSGDDIHYIKVNVNEHYHIEFYETEFIFIYNNASLHYTLDYRSSLDDILAVNNAFRTLFNTHIGFNSFY